MDTKQLRQKILDLAIRGKLVPQDPNDEPASVLLERIKAEKERLIAEGKIKRSKKSAPSSDKPHYPFEIPDSWIWTTLGELSNYGTCINVAVEDIPDGSWVLELEDLEKDTARLIQKLNKSERDIKGVRHRFEKGNILYSKLRTYLNKVLVADNQGFCTTEIIPFSLFGGISEFYINLVLRSNFFVDYTIQCGFGVKMPRLSTTDAHSGQIPLPPLKEQKRIVEKVEQLLSIVNLIEQEQFDLLKSASKLKNRILELAISGKLVPQGPTDEPAADLLKRVNPNAVVSADTSHYKFDIPNNWIISQLGNLFNHNTGKALNRSNQEGRMLDYITTSNLYWDRFELNNLKQMPFKESEIDKCTVIKGDLLVCEGGDVGRAAIWNYDYSICIQNHIHRLRPIDNHLVFPRFYYYCFLLYKQQNLIGGKGIGIQGLSSNQLHKVVFPLPSLNEQKRIASKVDELFAVIDQIQQSLE